jgi:hypothetical protein
MKVTGLAHGHCRERCAEQKAKTTGMPNNLTRFSRPEARTTPLDQQPPRPVSPHAPPFNFTIAAHHTTTSQNKVTPQIATQCTPTLATSDHIKCPCFQIVFRGQISPAWRMQYFPFLPRKSPPNSDTAKLGRLAK